MKHKMESRLPGEISITSDMQMKPPVSVQFSHSVMSNSMWPQESASQASLFITNSRSSLKLIFIESVMPSRHLILCRPLLLLPPIPSSIRVFSNESVLPIRWPKYWSFSPSASVLPINIEGWSHLGLTNLISLSKGLSRVISSITVRKHQFFSTQSSLWPSLTSIRDYWKNHTFDYMDLCRRSDVSAF